MKIYPNEFWLEEFEVHFQDDVNFYHYEVVGRELFTWTFAKKKAYIVGPSHLHCTGCGMKYGSNGCIRCKPFIKQGNYLDGTEYGVGLKVKINELTDNHLYLHRKIEGSPPNSWKQWHKNQRPDDKILIRYICHNCKYFMYHHINYCYKCGKKLQRSANTYGEFAKQCEGYRSGF